MENESEKFHHEHAGNGAIERGNRRRDWGEWIGRLSLQTGRHRRPKIRITRKGKNEIRNTGGFSLLKMKDC